MDFTDQTLTCTDCQEAFLWPANEQSFFAEKGFDEPKRCRPCRAKKRDRYRDDERGPAERG